MVTLNRNRTMKAITYIKMSNLEMNIKFINKRDNIYALAVA